MGSLKLRQLSLVLLLLLGSSVLARYPHQLLPRLPQSGSNIVTVETTSTAHAQGSGTTAAPGSTDTTNLGTTDSTVSNPDSTGTETAAATGTTGGSSGVSSNSSGSGQTYKLADNYVGNDFFSTWNWFTDDDPTHGRVNYVDMNTAKSSNLSSGDRPFFYPVL